MPQPPETEHFHILGEILELRPNLFWLVRIGAQTNDVPSKLHVPDQDVPVKLRGPEPILPICLGIDLKPLAVLYQIFQYLINKAWEIPVLDTLFRLWGVTDNIVEMTHDVKIAQLPHLAQQCLKISAIGFLPILTLVIRPEIRISVL